MKKRVMLILSCLFISMGFIVAQTSNISGIVVDEQGEAVIGASVVVKGTTNGTVTDIDGKFSINVTTGNSTLVFSLVGMKTIEERAKNGMRVTMQEDTKVLEDVVVIGYGTTKRATFTGSAARVDNKALTDVTVSSVDKALQGNATGVLTQAASGQPGAGQRIVIRGIGSINAGTEPLWIIDGIPVATGNFGQLTATGETTYSDNSNALAGLNPNDIQSITLLKDAAATSIYGSRAANGVVVVTTKSGSEGKTKFFASANYGWSRRASNKFKVLNQQQYIDYMTDALYNTGDYTSKQEATSDLLSSFPSTSDGKPYNFDWIDAAYRNDAPTFSFDLSANGGNSKTKFFLSAGFFKQEGILEASGINRVSNKFNINHSYSDKLRFGLSSTLSFVRQDTPLTTSAYFANPVLASSILPPIDPGIINGEVLPRTTVLSSNFLSNVKYNYAQQRVFRVLESAYAEYDILNNLTAKTQVGVDFMQNNEAQWDDPRVGGNTASTLGGRGTRAGSENLIWNIATTLNYNKTFNDVHNLGVMVGHEVNDETLRYMLAASEGFPTTEFQELSSGANPSSARSDNSTTRLVSLFTRVNYSYGSKYNASASFRRDSSSRFLGSNRYANFWSVGGQWRISQEDFMKDASSSWLSNLALRSSYGTTGNSNILSVANQLRAEYAFRGLYAGGYSYNGAAGIAPYQIYNPDLRWEQVASFNLGVDFAVFNNRLSTSLEFYNKKTNDLLLSVPISSTTGYTTALRNVGNMQNRGIEFTITGIPIVTKDFEWTVSLNVSHNQNKVLKLYEGQDIIKGSRIYREGEDFQSIYTYKWAGVDPEDGAQMWYAADGSKVKDVTKANRQIVGSAAPNYFGGLTNTIKFKDFDISALIYFSQGNDITDQTLQMVNSFGARGLFNQSVDLLNRWQKPGDITDVPKVIYGITPAVQAPMSTRYVYDGSYIRLRNLNIGYKLPMVQGMRIFFQGTNLLTLTDYVGLDPEVGINGDPWFGYPVSKTIAFGFNYNF